MKTIFFIIILYSYSFAQRVIFNGSDATTTIDTTIITTQDSSNDAYIILKQKDRDELIAMPFMINSYLLKPFQIKNNLYILPVEALMEYKNARTILGKCEKRKISKLRELR